MVVSFVNAGLLTLLQPITVIMGPISEPPLLPDHFAFGFKVSIAAFSVPLYCLIHSILFFQ